MIFLNYIKFKHGKLVRGEKCLCRGILATYLGTYVENQHTVHMMRMDSIVSRESGVPVICDYIEQCTDKSDIVCIKQQEPAIEGQMQLC